MNVFSRKISWFNMSFTQELVTTMFVRVCLAAASVFKTDSHMGFNYLTDKFRARPEELTVCCRLFAVYGQLWDLDHMGNPDSFTGSIITIC